MHRTTKAILQEFMPSFFGYYRQFDKKFSPFARSASSVCPTIVLGYDAMTDAQAQTGATFLTLGGEEGVEDIVKIFRGDPRTVIRKSAPDMPLTFLGLDSQFSAIVCLGHGLLSIQNEIQKDLLYLVEIEHYLWQAGG